MSKDINSVNDQYTLILSGKQAQIVSLALNLFSRIQAGQFDMMLSLGMSLPVSTEKRQLVRHLLDQASHEYSGLPKGASYGILSREIHDDARVAYDIHQVIRHRLYWDRNPESKTFWFVDGDEPWKTSFSEELPVIRTNKFPSMVKGILTERETEVLKYILREGYNREGMASEFVVSPHTVKSHIRAIFEKLGVNNMTDAILKAIRLKMVEV